MTSRERRGILAVALVALLVTGAGVVMRLSRPALPAPAVEADTVRVLVPADSVAAPSGGKKQSESRQGKKKAARKKKSPAKAPRPAPVSPLDRPVKTI